jgi:hypothetical protein
LNPLDFLFNDSEVMCLFFGSYSSFPPLKIIR